jgi:hypothetical protein
MLPDFPVLKQKLMRLREARMNDIRRKEGGPFSRAKVVDIDEGDRIVTVDQEGYQSKVRMKEHSARITLTNNEFENMTQAEIEEKFNEAARQIGIQAEGTMIEAIDEAVERSGNHLKQVGPFTVKAYLDSLDQIDLYFDKQGNPVIPTIVCGQQMYDEMSKVFAEPTSSEDLRRYLQIIERKREDWRDRENSRKLAD